jgi:hypothetical protein
VTRYLAALAVVVAGVCTTAMNWRFSYQLGTTEFDAYLWATFSVALDVCKWLMLPIAARAGRARMPRAIAAAAIWLVATCYSFAAALGFAAYNREITAAERRSQTQIHRTLLTMQQSPRWQSSAACADSTTKQSKEFCAAYRRVESKLTALPQQDDPQSALIAHLTGLSQEQAPLVLALSLAVACELVSALGFFAIALGSPGPHPISGRRHQPQERRQARSSGSNASPDLDKPRWRPRKNN